MAEEDMAYSVMEVLGEHSATGLIALMTAWREDALLQIGRVGTSEQHIYIMISLDDDMVSRTYVCCHIFARRAGVGSYHESLSHEVYHVSYAFRRVMRYIECIDCHAGHSRYLKWHRLFEIMPTGAELGLHAIVAVDTRMYGSCGVDRQVDAFAQCTYGADMVCVVVRDEYRHDVGKIQPHLSQVLLYGTSRDAGIDENAALGRAQVVAVAATT